MHRFIRGDNMSDNMNDLFANVKKMVDSGNIPDDIKQMMNNFQNSSNNNNSNNSPNENSNGFNIDMNTIMKMQNIMNNMNNKNDPRANLLYSLKPYLRDSKKEKLNQYVNLLNISKIADIMNKKDDNKHE